MYLSMYVPLAWKNLKSITTTYSKLFESLQSDL